MTRKWVLMRVGDRWLLRVRAFWEQNWDRMKTLCCLRCDPICFGAHLELWDSETISNKIERTGWKRRLEGGKSEEIIEHKNDKSYLITT